MPSLGHMALTGLPLIRGAAVMAIALLALLPLHAKAADLQDVIATCTEGSADFNARVAGLEALGFKRIRSEGKLWVQGQVTHIAMAELEYGTQDDPADLRGTYDSFWALASKGELFRDDIKSQQFINASGNIELAFSRVDGDWACSLAYGVGATELPVTLRAKKQWKSNAGTYTEYRINRGRFASGSTISPVWDRWIKGKRLVAAFLTVSEEP